MSQTQWTSRTTYRVDDEWGNPYVVFSNDVELVPLPPEPNITKVYMPKPHIPTLREQTDAILEQEESKGSFLWRHEQKVDLVFAFALTICGFIALPVPWMAAVSFALSAIALGFAFRNDISDHYWHIRRAWTTSRRRRRLRRAQWPE